MFTLNGICTFHMKTMHCTNTSKQYIHKKYDQYSTGKLFTNEKTLICLFN